MFQENLPVASNYDEKYVVNYAGMKEADLRLTHAAHTYANVIEEATYGRQMLDVGYCVPHNMKFFENRGWITWGIDVNKDTGGKGNLYRGDFTTFDFDIPANTDELKAIAGADKFERKFDLIWMNHSFEHFNDPMAALRKAYNLLSETGVLYIGTPDISFMHKTGVPGFPHFKTEEHYVMWTEEALKREVERVGFKVIVCRRNFSSRYSSWYDIHLVAQKNYF
jgi:SAM-dependent methyltransferase